MLKRKAASHQEQGSVDDEKQVYNAAGLELPVQTLLNAINVGKGDFHRRMQMIIRSLRLDGRRTHSLLDLSTTPSADQVCAHDGPARAGWSRVGRPLTSAIDCRYVSRSHV
jgi:hypothetical protein